MKKRRIYLTDDQIRILIYGIRDLAKKANENADKHHSLIRFISFLIEKERYKTLESMGFDIQDEELVAGFRAMKEKVPEAEREILERLVIIQAELTNALRNGDRSCKDMSIAHLFEFLEPPSEGLFDIRKIDVSEEETSESVQDDRDKPNDDKVVIIARGSDNVQ